MNSIPKQLTFYWSGKNISWLRYLTLYTAKKFNPDWDIKLFIGPNPMDTNRRPWESNIKQDFFIYKGKNYWEEVEKLDIQICDWTLNIPQDFTGNKLNLNRLHPPQLCDLFEWETLYKNGGFFADMDIIFLKSLNPLYDQIVNSNSESIVCYYSNMFRIGFTAAKQGSQFYKDLFYAALRFTNEKQYESCGAFSIYGMLGLNEKHLKSPSALMREIRKKNYYEDVLKKYNNMYNLDKHNMYHWDHNQLNGLYNDCHPFKVIPIQTYGVHWYAGFHKAQDLNNKINETNYLTFNNTMSNIIKHVMES